MRWPLRPAAFRTWPGRSAGLPGGGPCADVNIAMTLRRFGLTPALLTAIGRDEEGRRPDRRLRRRWAFDRLAYRSDDLPTDRYMAIEGANGLIAAIADAHSLEAAGAKILRRSPTAGWAPGGRALAGPVALDGNLTSACWTEIALARFARADLRVAPASPARPNACCPSCATPRATLYLNLEEAGILCQQRASDSREAAHALIARGAARVLVTDGAATHRRERRAERPCPHTPPEVLVTRVTGAGDTFMAAHIAAETRGAARGEALAARWTPPPTMCQEVHGRMIDFMPYRPKWPTHLLPARPSSRWNPRSSPTACPGRRTSRPPARSRPRCAPPAPFPPPSR
jgi:pseudouridine kinase